MLSKEKVKQQIDRFPDSFTLDDLVEKLILLDKYEKGLAQSNKNEVISDEDLEEEIKKW